MKVHQYNNSSNANFGIDKIRDVKIEYRMARKGKESEERERGKSRKGKESRS